MRKLVSVIIPVYNVEKYIRKTVESLLVQTYSDIEILLINDGSIDNSLNIILELKKRDKRISVFNNTNHGVSYTRNYGIKNAKGEYVVFIDGDDWVEKDHIEYLYNLVKKNNYCIGIGLEHYTDNQSNQNNSLYANEIKPEAAIIDIYTNKLYMASWNKIYEREYLKQNNILFNEELWYAEGMHFNIQCLCKCKKVIVGNKKTYHYMSNPKSAMRSGFNYKNEKNALYSLELQREMLLRAEYPLKVIMSLEYHRMMIYYLILLGTIESKENNNEIKKESIREIHARKWVPLRTNLSLKQKIKWTLISLFPLVFAKRDKRIIKNIHKK